MHKKLWLSIAAAIVGAGLLVAASSAGTATNKTVPVKAGHAVAGGTYNVELSTDVDYTDPGLDYLSSGWELEYATTCKLLNYPDKPAPAGSQLTPEVAAGFPTITNNGKLYTFTIRPGFKFSTGQPVTAKSFADALNRDANPKLQSPAQPFMDVITGANAMINGKAASISGVKAVGNKLTIALDKASPDLLARLAMPFFSAINPQLAASLDPNGVNAPAGCGPYYIAARTINKSITIKRNPYYKGTRPHNVNEIDYKIGNTLDVIQQDVDSGTTDYAAQGLNPQNYAPLAAKYGVNKGRFWIEPYLGVRYVAMNNDRPLIKGNLALRQAVNWAVDRRAIINQRGFGSGNRLVQILPPGMPGFRLCKTGPAPCYPINVTAATVKKAQALAKGHTGDGNAVLYTSNRGAAPLIAQILQFNLKQIGLNLEVDQFARAVQIEKEGTRGAPFDFTYEGWVADYADPFDFINVLLSGDSLHAANNNNVAYFNDPKYNQAMLAASRLVGNARYNAYGALDVDITKNAAPWAETQTINDQVYVSARTGCFTWTPVYSVDLAAVCLK
jgi:ABC-type oligopeptide transport system substrate-binding subunit